MSKIISCVLLSLFLLSSCDCADVFHEESKIIFSPDLTADYFGYAVAFGKTGLLVGAPKATTRGDTEISAGVVFTCSLENLQTTNVSCTHLKIKGLKNLKNGMMFGASLAVGPSGKVVICAPNWAREREIDREEKRMTMDLIGACYLKMKRRETFVLPLANYGKQWLNINNSRTEYIDYHFNNAMTSIKYYALAEAGMALKVTEDRIIIGAPGLLVGSGGVVQYTYIPNESSISYHQDVTYNPYFTHDVRPDEYFGYSVESGVFEDSGKILYVVGGPRAKRGLGMVLVIEPATSEDAPLNILAKLEGPQFGAYFGASLSCLDINADGRIDLLVGAPNYVKQFPRDNSYDEGAVFVYLNKEQATGFVLDYAGRVTGSEVNGAKFGYSIADLGDVDGDGYNDVAISSPWENNGAGSVYIYGGDKNGLKNNYLQKLVANGAKGFGFGLTRGYDVDNNNCNDLVIGAYKSGAVYMYRCIPTVKVQLTINVPGALNLPQNTTNFTAEFCVKVQPVKDYRTSIQMDFNAVVTIDHKEERAKIAGNSIHSYKVSTGPSTSHCDIKVIEIMPTADLSRPIPIIFDLEHIDRMQDNPTQFKADVGRVSKDSNLHAILEIQLVKECGKDLICTPWLEMELKAINETYIPGSEGRLGAIVTVLNKEEPAFGIRINLTLPSLPKRVPKTCFLQGFNMTCNLPSPFNRNQTSMWEVELEYNHTLADMGVAMIDAHIIDPVADRNISDNASQYLEIAIIPKANITVSGKALPNATVAVSREKINEGSNITVVHYFQIINSGPSDWYELTATVLVTGKVSLATKEVVGCEESWESGSLALACSWSVNAMQSMPVVLPLRCDLNATGIFLEAESSYNITSTLYLDQQNKSLTLTTTLDLEPVSELWIFLVIAITVGIFLLAILSCILYKNGFFSRPDRNKHEQLLQNKEQLEKPGSSSEPQCTESANEDLPKPSCSYNNSADPSKSDGRGLAELTFQGPSDEHDRNWAPVYSNSPTTIAEATTVYRSLQRQLSQELDSSM